MAVPKDQKELVRRFADAVNDRNYAAVRDAVIADVERICPATPDVVVRNVDDLLQFLQHDAATFPDSRINLDALVAEDDHVAVWATYTGTQHGPMGPFPPSDRRMAVEFAGIIRIEGGRIARIQVTWDNVSVLTQLGHLAIG